jgi:hypothetical protein
MRPSSLRLIDICEQIAGLSIEVVDADGAARQLSIRTLVTAQLSLAEEVLPVLQPRMNGFVFNLSPMRRDSFGSDGGYKSQSFELHYALYFAKLSEEVSALELVAPMAQCASDIVSQFSDMTDRIDAATEIFVGGVPAFGPVIDGTGTPYHGAQIFFQVMRHLES